MLLQSVWRCISTVELLHCAHPPGNLQGLEGGVRRLGLAATDETGTRDQHHRTSTCLPLPDTPHRVSNSRTPHVSPTVQRPLPRIQPNEPVECPIFLEHCVIRCPRVASWGLAALTCKRWNCSSANHIPWTAVPYNHADIGPRRCEQYRNLPTTPDRPPPASMRLPNRRFAAQLPV